MTWSPPRVVRSPDRDGAGLQLGVGLGHDLVQATDLDHREAQAAQRGEEVQVGLAPATAARRCTASSCL